MPRRDAELETVDLDAVEILAVGGPVHGKGSPPEGDYWTADQLRDMADADAALHGELHPTARLEATKSKVGHVEQPAVGYLENLRLNDDETKLLADVRAVPKKLAKIVKAGGYRARSVELSKVTSQKTGKTYDWVVTGLAWLGAKLPAVRTLDDVVALYEDGDVEVQLVVEYEQGSVVWEPDQGLEGIRRELQAALNPGPAGSPWNYWVRDVAPSRALVEESGPAQKAWVVPYTRENGAIQLAPTEQWTAASQAWVEAARTYEEERAKSREASADSRANVAERKYTDEQVKAFAEATGLEAEKVTDEMLEASGVAVETEEPKPDGDDDTDDTDKPEGDEVSKELEARLTKAENGAAAANEKLRLNERKTFVEAAIKDGKVSPGAREKLERLYDKDPEGAEEFVAEIKADADLAREYGSDDAPADEQEAFTKAYEADAAMRLGIPVEALI